MNDQPQPTSTILDLTELSRSVAGIVERSRRLLASSMHRQIESTTLTEADPLNVGDAFMRMTVEMTANPTQMVQSGFNLWQDYLTLWINSAQRILGQDTAPTIEPAADDWFNGATQHEGSW